MVLLEICILLIALLACVVDWFGVLLFFVLIYSILLTGKPLLVLSVSWVLYVILGVSARLYVFVRCVLRLDCSWLFASN